MITVTEYAKEELKTRLRTKTDDPNIGLRLATGTPGKLKLVQDWQQEGDQVVTHEGANVLLVDEKISDLLDGATIDYRETESGKRLVICQ